MDTLSLLQTKFTPNTIGLLWLTCEHFSTELPHYHHFNYFFDGLFSSQTKISNTKDDKQLKKIFFTRNFGAPFFIAHIKIPLSIIQKNISDKKKRTHKDIEPLIEEVLGFTKSLRPKKAESLTPLLDHETQNKLYYLDEENTFSHLWWKKRNTSLTIENLFSKK